MSRQVGWVAKVVVPASLVLVAASRWPGEVEVPEKPPAVRRATLEPFAPLVPELPPSEPSAAVPTLSEAARADIESRARALAAELARMWTRDSEQLVAVIDDAARQAPTSPSVTLLLAIAHAETNGKILDVSEAGAVGLAQATPVAVRQEGTPGKVFVTNDYLIGSRAYIMKKPLGDADTIASMVVNHDSSKTRARARRLLDSALALRLEGVDELTLLEVYADSDVYKEKIAEAKRHNLATLRKLEKLLANGSRAEIRAFRDATRREYRTLKQTQVTSWRRYQEELIARRDSMLEEHFGADATTIKRTRPYEAAEYLGAELDVRFSAKAMASFLVQHLDRKAGEARRLRASRGNIEEWTAALYNGGSHNVKRMLAGLIASLPETQRYMKKVPATRKRLDRSVAMASASPDPETQKTLR